MNLLVYNVCILLRTGRQPSLQKKALQPKHFSIYFVFLFTEYMESDQQQEDTLFVKASRRVSISAVTTAKSPAVHRPKQPPKSDDQRRMSRYVPR